MADYEDLSRRLRYLSDFVREGTTILTVYEYVSVCRAENLVQYSPTSGHQININYIT
jgi:hypothetical protein